MSSSKLKHLQTSELLPVFGCDLHFTVPAILHFRAAKRTAAFRDHRLFIARVSTVFKPQVGINLLLHEEPTFKINGSYHLKDFHLGSLLWNEISTHPVSSSAGLKFFPGN